MALNPQIILSGQPLNAIGHLAAGQQAGQMQRERVNQNALAGFLQGSGGDVMRGDPKALNALASYGMDGLNAAQNVQTNRLNMANTQQGMEARTQQMGMLDAQEARAIEQHAASLSAAQRAEEAARIEEGVRMGLMLPDAAAWDAMAAQAAPELVGQFDNREALAGKYMSIAEILKRQDAQTAGPGFRPATPEEAAQYGAQAGQFDTETGRFYPNDPPTGMEITSDGNGGFTLTQGPGAGGSGRPPTEGQLAGAGYLQRMTGAEQTIQGLAEQGVTTIPLAATVVSGTILESFALTPEQQQLAQAYRDWVRAKLRKESGAVIAPEEMAEEVRTYFPQPGDGPEVIKQKAESRRRAERQMEIGAGSAAPQAGALTPPPDAGGGEVTAQMIQQMTPGELADFTETTDITKLPDDVIDAMIARMGDQ